MHTTDTSAWRHEPTFGQDRVRRAERRTVLVMGLTAVFMVVELVAGVAFGSMALVADGLHMASHAVALGISAAAYALTRRYAADERFSFGTGKMNALGGFAGALLLVAFALVMAVESVEPLVNPVAIVFDQAIVVAAPGLLVNVVSFALLGHEHDVHDHDEHDHDEHDHDEHHEHDHVLRSATLHVLADALTSVLALVALLAGRSLGWTALDPVMGLVGAALISRWSWGLLRATGAVLLDGRARADVRDGLRTALERDGDRVVDLHVWSIGPGIHATCLSVVAHAPEAPGRYRERIPAALRVVHATIEVHACAGDPVKELPAHAAHG